MFGPGEEFLGAQSTTISFFFSLTEVPKNRSHPRLIQEYFLLSLLLLPMMRVNPIELFFTDSFFFFSSSNSPCGNFDYLTGPLHKTMSSSRKLRRKSLTVIIILGGRLERRKELVGRFESSLRWHDGSQRWWERTFDWIVRILSSRRFAWNPEMQSLSSSKKLFVDPKTIFSDALSLLQKLMADFRSSKRT